MHKLVLGLLLLGLWSCSPSRAQTAFTMPPPAGVTVIGAESVTSCGGGALSAGVAFITVDATGALCVTGTVTATSTNPVGLATTDRTIASASGSSQQIMAANATRHSMVIQNTGSANCGVNPTGGTAAIGGAGTLTLAPLGSYSPRVPSVSAVTVICTAGQPIYASEN